VATWVGGEMQTLVELSAADAWPIRQLMIGKPGDGQEPILALTPRDLSQARLQ